MKFQPAATALIACFIVAGLCGCVAPPGPQPSFQVVSTLTQEREVLRKDLADRKSNRAIAKMQDEIDRLNKDILDLEARIASLDDRISNEELRARKQSTSTGLPSGCLCL
ncbi:MAG: hypothetical protein IPN53_05225 [Comamonadaceae bacterium]|nr:hypothetical protein [Comamonadaceae bacterium]